jgi:hypothetical protein
VAYLSPPISSPPQPPKEQFANKEIYDSHPKVIMTMVMMQISLSAAPAAASQGRSVVLKAQGAGRLGNNLVQSSFWDGAAFAFPEQAVGMPAAAMGN